MTPRTTGSCTLSLSPRTDHTSPRTHATPTLFLARESVSDSSASSRVWLYRAAASVPTQSGWIEEEVDWWVGSRTAVKFDRGIRAGGSDGPRGDIHAR